MSESPEGLILERRARVLARTFEDDVDDEKILSLMTFSLGNERYGVEIDFVLEIQPLHAGLWTRVPNSPGFIIGAVNIRGRIYSVMDAARFLGLPSREMSVSPHVLLVRGREGSEAGEMELCILAEDLPQAGSIPLEDIQQRQSGAPGQTHNHVFGVTDEMLVILDLEHLLEDPRIAINEEIQ